MYDRIKFWVRLILKARNNYLTYWIRPRNEKFINPNVIPKKSYKEYGIVVQGNLRLEDNFTFETLKYYRRMYPEAHIVLSCWNTDDKKTIEKVKELNVEVVISEFPKQLYGYGPNNLQLQTTSAGISCLDKYGCKYILKTRSDQRIYEPDALSYLMKMLNTFPIRLNCGANGRLISCSLSTFVNRLYNISDMMIFGYSSDVKRYFSCPVDSRNYATPYLDDQIEYSKLRTGEIYFASHYIESLGFNLKWTIEDSNLFRKELFIIVDSEDIDQFWPKYTQEEYRWRRYNQGKLKQGTYKEWFCLQD